jgi:SAM-dependent methyltransferase
MHAAALMLMKQAICRALPRTAVVLDVGSYDVNGTFRPLIEELGWHYTGLDIRQGPNVDIVVDDPYAWPVPDDAYSVVICGNMLHNTAEPWRLIPEMVRVLTPGGMLAIVTHTWGKPPSGKHPIDAWRFMPDGMQILFDLTEQLIDYEIESGEQDIVASAFKGGTDGSH